jgi:hypothetical protein
MAQTGPKVPNTISDRDYANLQRRAIRTETVRGGMFTRRSVARRLATAEQRRKAGQS